MNFHSQLYILFLFCNKLSKLFKRVVNKIVCLSVYLCSSYICVELQELSAQIKVS